MPNCLFHYQTAAHFSMALSSKEALQSVSLIESEFHLLIKGFVNASNGFLVCILGQAEIQSKYALLFVSPALGQAVVGVIIFVFLFFFPPAIHTFMYERDLGPEK